ncbi:MAG: DNA internalization-related competence protein ComEC/Rec2 [Actinobacteria bacterium]|nr:DNA internalization-related competence protein ComEC/Rec2 [Actinomycetota bacterium]
MPASRIIYRGRLLWCACAMALGGVAGCAGPFPAILLALVSMGACAAGISLIPKGWKRGLVCACALFALAGLILGHSRHAHWRGREGAAGEVLVRGVIEPGSRGDKSEIVSLFRVVEAVEGGSPREGDLYLLRTGDARGEELSWGDRVEVRGSLYLFGKASGGAGGSLTAKEIRVLGGTGNPMMRAANAYRGALRKAVGGEGPGEAGLIQGMVLGDYRFLEAGDLRALRLSGLVHLCAASGLHVAILAAFLNRLGRWARMPRRLVAILQAPLLATYALAAGLTAPVVRAAAVGAVAALAFLRGRDFDFLPALGAAMMFMVASDPGAAAGVSFQLSFAAALGISVLHRPLESLLAGSRRRGSALLAATLAAQLSVAPLLLYRFGEVSLLAPLGNVLVIPLVAPLMAMAMLSALLGMAGLPAAGILMRGAALCARAVICVAHTVAAPTWASLRLFPLPFVWIALYYPILATAFLSRGSWRRAGRLALAAMLAAALLCGLPWPEGAMGGGDGTGVVFLDVGQGDAALLRSPSGSYVLVDGGRDDGVLASDLRSRGIRYLEAVVASHLEMDHIGGLEGALETCSVGVLIHPEVEEAGRAGERLIALAGEAGIPVRSMRRGDVLSLGELRLEALGPSGDIPDEAPANERSLVLRASAPGFSVLFTGDVEEVGQEFLARQESSLESDILKVPHHGGYAATGAEFFALVDPEVAVISVGEDNPYGHPARATLDALERLGCAVYRTDRRGDILIHVEHGGYRVECQRQDRRP